VVDGTLLAGSKEGIFNIGLVVGGTTGAIIGGMVAYYFSSWRLAFFIASLPGFVLAYFAFRIKDEKVKHNEPKLHIKTLFKNHAYIWVVISGIFVSFAAGSFETL